MKKHSYTSITIALFFALISFNSCKKTHDPQSPPTVAPVTKLVKLQTSSVLGSYLTDKTGLTLYYFSNDFNGQNNCPGGCALAWPVFSDSIASSDQLGEGLNKADFGTITIAGGIKQVTYKTWPLYYYAPVVNGINVQEASGEVKGENVGGVWFVAKPDYTIMLVNAQLVGANGKNYKSDYTEGNGRTIYFSDGKGVTLYGFKNDKANKNNFTKSDFSNNASWPIYETDKIVIPSSLDKTLFGSIEVFGKKQLTYKGWPLYYFGQDANVRGMTKGVSVGQSPGLWPVVGKNIAAATP
jgi:predicted lipoprotein with Yx(FWY)xxD motif